MFAIQKGQGIHTVMEHEQHGPSQIYENTSCICALYVFIFFLDQVGVLDATQDKIMCLYVIALNRQKVKVQGDVVMGE